jgi:hypothetical protein
MAPSNPQPPPGWYPDPASAAQLRWWDGYGWTEHTQPSYPDSYPIGVGYRVPMDDPASCQRSEAGMYPWARWAPVVAMAINAGNTLVLFAERNVLVQFHHYLQQVFAHAGRPGYRPPPLPHPSTGYQLIDLLSLPGIACQIIFLIWQYRAAKTARALGYPARHSPGWGVGSWFVPIVNLWIPYQSLADCLQAGHPTRKGLVWVPLAYYLGLPVASVALLAAEFFGVGVGPLIVAVMVSVLLAGFVGWRGWRFVTAVHADHDSGVAAARAGRSGTGGWGAAGWGQQPRSGW